MVYKVYFDSNQLFNKNGPLNEVFDNTIQDLLRFLDMNGQTGNVEICIPEIVIQERIQTSLERVDAYSEKANSGLAGLKQLGYDVEKISILSQSEHRDILEKNAAEVISKYGIKRIPIGSIDPKILVDKSISKIKPFNDKGVGLKDTLIYLSIVQDARNDTDSTQYILCSNNPTQFDDDVERQFKQNTGKDLYIVSNLEALKEKLDELIPLRLHLEERNNKIKEFLKGKTGTITKILNDSIFQRKGAIGGRTVGNLVVTSSVYSSTFIDGQDAIAGYDYRDFEITNIDDIGNDDFRISANMTTEIIYRSQNGSPTQLASDTDLHQYYVVGGARSSVTAGYPVYGSMYGMQSQRQTVRIFRTNFICNPKTQKISLESGI